MKLQLALDLLNLKESLIFSEKLAPYVDIFEIGTPLIIRSGVKAVREFKKSFPNTAILADLKIMDGGAFETELAIEAGADYVTVLGVTDISTIKGCLDACNKLGKQLVVDMLCVSHMEERIKVLEEIGVHYLAVHTGVDQQKTGRTPLQDLKTMKQSARHSKIAVAGGISRHTIAEYTVLQPDIVIVGNAVMSAIDPLEEVQILKNMLGKG